MNATAKMSGYLADEIVMLEAVTDFPLFLRWAAEQERFAKTIAENHPARNAAVVMLDNINHAMVRAATLNQTGNDWRDDRVNQLMLDTMAKHAEVDHWLRVMTSKRQSTRASVPRKNVTKAALTEYREAFRAERDTDRGWIKAACLHFGIDRGTLNARLRTRK